MQPKIDHLGTLMIGVIGNIHREKKDDDDCYCHKYGIEKYPTQTTLYDLSGIEHAERESEHEIFVA